MFSACLPSADMEVPCKDAFGSVMYPQIYLKLEKNGTKVVHAAREWVTKFSVAFLLFVPAVSQMFKTPPLLMKSASA